MSTQANASLDEQDFAEIHSYFDELLSQFDGDFDDLMAMVNNMDLSQDEEKIFHHIGKAISHAASSVGNSLKKSFEAAGKWVMNAGKSVGKWLSDPNVQMCLKKTAGSVMTNVAAMLSEE